MNNKIKKITLAAVAILVIASGCSDKNNDENNAAENVANNNQSVVEQPQDSDNNDQANDATGENNDDENSSGGLDQNDGNSSTEEDEQSDDNSGNDSASGGSDDEQPADQTDDAAAGEVTVGLIAEKVQTEVQMGSLMDLDNEQVKDMYGIDPTELLEDGVFLPAMFNISSHELAVVKLKSDEHYDAVKEAMEQRAASIQKTFENYLPDQYEASKNYQIIRKGDFVLFSITADQEKAAEVFESLIQE